MFPIADLFNVYSLFAVCAILFCWYCSQSTYNYWQKLNIPYLKPIPFFGNTARYVLQLDTYQLTIHQLYKDLGNVPFGGIFHMREPLLIIKDPKLAANILVRDFNVFPNRYQNVTINEDKNVNPLSGHLGATKGERWKTLRLKFTPVFSPAKLKLMCHQIEHCLDWLNQRVLDKMAGTGSVDVSLKELSGRLIIDAVGACVLGIECDSLKSNDKFVSRCSEIFNPDFQKSARIVLKSVSCYLSDTLGLSEVKKETVDFFSKMLLDAILYRRQSGGARDDLFQLLINLQNSCVDPKYAVQNDKKMLISEQFSELDIAANAFFFLVSAYESTHGVLSLCLYELALNENVQDKLYCEIQQMINMHQTLSYDSINEMTFLNAVITETLRKYPASVYLNRKSVEDYIIEETKTFIPKGTIIIIPQYSIQRDWRYFSNPEVFNPERFINNPNLAKTSGIYLPFGDGPRYCIGKRFALLLLKMAVSNIVLNYNLSPCTRTEIPIKFKGGSKALTTVCGTWANLTRRKI